MTDFSPGEPQVSAQTIEKPTSVTVFGVLNIVFGGIGLLFSSFVMLGFIVAGEKLVMNAHLKIWSLVVVIVRIGFSIWLLILGIGLLKMSKWARRGSVIYAWVRIIWMIAVVGSNFAALSGWVAVPEGAMPRFLGGVCGGILGLIYPILLLIVMQTAKVKRAFPCKGLP